MAESSDAADHRQNETLSAEAQRNLRTPIAVILLNAQLLERWVRRAEPADADQALTRLTVMTTMLWRGVLELDALREGDRAGAYSEEPSADP